jgi:hypothetical protein
MYFEGLNSEFANFIAEKVKYNVYVSVYNIWLNPLLSVDTSNASHYIIKPLFNFDNVTSTNSKDHTENNDVLIIRRVTSTLLSFNSNVETMEYSEMKSEKTIEGIKYTVYYTYDNVTGEPARFKMTSSGNVTDMNGYYIDSEVVS